MGNGPLSYEYIRGLVDGEGTFTFSTSNKRKMKIPAFAIKMNARDKHLIEMVRDTLGIKNKVYEYNHQKNDGFKRDPQAMLIVREFGRLKNVIVPLFYKRLMGNKGRQFEEWIFKIESEPWVPKTYKLIPRLYKEGFYDRNNKFS